MARKRWQVPADFVERLLSGATRAELERDYRAGKKQIQTAFDSLPLEVQHQWRAIARERGLRVARANLAILHAKVNGGAGPRQRKEPVGRDPLAARYAEVAARRGWLVREYAA